MSTSPPICPRCGVEVERPMGLGMAALLPGVTPSEAWGIGRSVPRGDVQ